jgi:hypothetical protein
MPPEFILKQMRPDRVIAHSADEAKISVCDLIEKKHSEYLRLSNVFRWLYYTTRLIGGLSAGLLPFFLYSHPPLAMGLSIAVVVVTVFDFVFSPKDRWQLYSKATDLLTIEGFKRHGVYDSHEGWLNILVNTEDLSLSKLREIEQTLHAARTSASQAQSQLQPPPSSGASGSST